MKKFLMVAVLLLIVCISGISGCKPPQQPVTACTTLNDCVYDPLCKDKMALGHRGTGSYNLWATENTLAAYEYAWKMGADSIETDVRKTKDGVLVIMHDSTVTKTAFGTGRVEDMTLAEIKALKMRRLNPDMPAQTIPTFTETLEYLKGKTLLDVDMKTDDMPAIINEIASAGMLDSAYLAGIGSVAQADLARSVNPAIAIMPKIKTLEQAKDFIENASPIAFFEIEYENAVPELVEYIHSNGVKIHINSLLNYDFLGRAGFSIVFDRGADIIQTDRLDVLVPYINSTE
jgi:glycerophosphoryl diester phosphodiesterase